MEKMTVHGWLSRPLTAWLLVAGAAALVAAGLGVFEMLQPAANPPLPTNAPAAAAAVVGLIALLMALTHALRLQRQQRRTHSETDRLEALVRERTAQLTELAQHLQTAREDERQRLARDLHDELGALLTSAKLDAARIKSRLAAPVPLATEALERLGHLASTLDQVIAVKRRIAEDLRPSALTHLGLVATLEILAREFTRNTGVAVHCALQPVPLAPAAELTAYRLVQEATTNVAKHAKANNVWLTLGLEGGQVQLGVRDDGIGYDTRVPPRSAYGLVGMRYRVEAEHGTLAVDAAPGSGTTIRVTLPPRQPPPIGA
ncbi:MAG: sensor histidine kinase [Rubrivivax sp.]|nr:sensor histidine kinase [Rubrivivax sp.]